jgi:hypothetical protein
LSFRQRTLQSKRALLRALFLLVSLLSQVHLRVTFASFVLCRRRRSNDGGIENGAFLEQQALRSQVAVDGVEYDLG